MANPIFQMFDFIIQSIFNLCIVVLILRFIFDTLSVNSYNPIYGCIHQVTEPIIKRLRRFFTIKPQLNLSALFCIIILQLVEVLISDLLEGRPFSLTAALVIGVGELLSLVLYIYIFSIIIQTLISWMGPKQYLPVNELLLRLNNPLIKPIQRRIPLVGDIDLTPIIVLIALGALHILSLWIINFGDTLAYR